MSKKDKTKKGRGGAVDLKDRTGSKNKVEPPKKYKCVMYNDDYTPMGFVVAILQIVFHKSPAESTRLMLDVHKKDRGIAGVYSKEIADTKCMQCKRMALEAGHPFLVQSEAE